MNYRSKELQKHVQSESDTLKHVYHYTDATGVCGILENDLISIWATNYRFLNDLSEGREAIDIAKKILENRISKSTDPLKPLLERMKELDTLVSDIYVCSFSAEKDSLSQWRAYCPQIGGGYALGFPTTVLKKMSDHYDCIFTKCVYDNETKKMILAEVIGHFVDEYLESLKNKEYEKVYENVDEFTDSTVFNFQRHVSKISLILKKKGFMEEKEYRLIYSESQSSKVEFRKGRNGLIPYQVLQYNNDEQAAHYGYKLMVGPSPLDESESLYAARKLFKKLFDTDSGVESSQIPFKGW